VSKKVFISMDKGRIDEMRPLVFPANLALISRKLADGRGEDSGDENRFAV
jgi:hypothetical protein